MKVAYGVRLTNKKPKTQDAQDRVNYGLFVSEVRFYRGRDRSKNLLTESVQRLATPMTNELAVQLAAKLQSQADDVSAFEFMTDDEQRVATNFIELGEEQAPVTEAYKGLGTKG